MTGCCCDGPGLEVRTTNKADRANAAKATGTAGFHQTIGVTGNHRCQNEGLSAAMRA